MFRPTCNFPILRARFRSYMHAFEPADKIPPYVQESDLACKNAACALVGCGHTAPSTAAPAQPGGGRLVCVCGASSILRARIRAHVQEFDPTCKNSVLRVRIRSNVHKFDPTCKNLMMRARIRYYVQEFDDTCKNSILRARIRSNAQEFSPTCKHSVLRASIRTYVQAFDPT